MERLTADQFPSEEVTAMIATACTVLLMIGFVVSVYLLGRDE